MTNTGTEKPTTEKPIRQRSSRLPARCAASTPSGTAISTASTIVASASERVGSTRCVISSDTGFLKKKLSPKSPLSPRPAQMKNCWKIGFSSPSLPRISATCSTVAVSPAITAAGSPGVRRSIRNTTTATVASTGTADSSRWAMKVSIGLTAARTSPLVLAHAPEQRRRRGDPAAEPVLAVGERLVPLPDPHVGADFERPQLDLLGDLLLLGRVGLMREGAAQVLHFRVAGPADVGRVPIGGEEG